jgi:pimeloyl-ACP methyl ester carboxylesterase
MKNKIELIDLSFQNPRTETFLNYWINNKCNINSDAIQEDKFQILKTNSSLKHVFVTLSTSEKIEVLIYGCGTPILLISGLGVIAPIWIKQIDKLSLEHQIIIIHMPGHGLSDTTGDLSYKGISNVIHEVIISLGINEKINIIGTCIGGSIAINFTAYYPEHVATLILAGSILEWDTKIFNDSSLNRKKVREVVSYLNSFSNKLTNDFNNIMDRVNSNYLLENSFFNLYSIHEISKCINPLSYVEYVLSLSKDGDLRNQVLKIKIPTLLLVGDEDSVVDIKNSYEMYRIIKGSEYYCILGAGHFPYITHSDIFNLKVKQFIQKNY